MPTTKQKKEYLVQSGKAFGQTKLRFAKKNKTIDEVSWFPSFTPKSSAKLLFFLFQVRSAPNWCRISYKLKFGCSCVSIGKTWARESLYFVIFHPVLTVTICGMIILIQH